MDVGGKDRACWRKRVEGVQREGKCRKWGNSSSLGRRRRISRAEARRVMDGEGSVRLQKENGEAGEMCSALKWIFVWWLC